MIPKRFGVLALILSVIAAMPAGAQERTVLQVWVFQMETKKTLPVGHHDFVPVSPEIGAQRLESDGQVICESFKGAISLGKRLWEGKTPLDAAIEISDANGGKNICGTLTRSTQLQPLALAIRSHDGVHRVYVLRLRDETGRIFYMVEPLR